MLAAVRQEQNSLIEETVGLNSGLSYFGQRLRDQVFKKRPRFSC